MQVLKINKPLIILSWSIIAFWALWSTLVALTDVVNFLQAIAWVPNDWVFTSNNFSLVEKSLSIFGLQNTALPIVLFFFIVALACFIAVLFWQALFAYRFDKNSFLQKSYIAFLASFALEAIFILADEIFIQYDFEHGHMDRLGFKLLTFLIFWALQAKSSHQIN